MQAPRCQPGLHARAGLATRSYLYVEDVAEAFDLILHAGVVGETYNIGSQRERSVLSVARDVLRLFGLPAAASSTCATAPSTTSGAHPGCVTCAADVHVRCRCALGGSRSQL